MNQESSVQISRNVATRMCRRASVPRGMQGKRQSACDSSHRCRFDGSAPKLFSLGENPKLLLLAAFSLHQLPTLDFDLHQFEQLAFETSYNLCLSVMSRAAEGPCTIRPGIDRTFPPIRFMAKKSPAAWGHRASAVVAAAQPTVTGVPALQNIRALLVFFLVFLRQQMRDTLMAVDACLAVLLRLRMHLLRLWALLVRIHRVEVVAVSAFA